MADSVLDPARRFWIPFCALHVVFGVLLGVGGSTVWLKPEPRVETFNWFYASVTNGKTNIKITPTGEAIIGLGYDRQTEAKKLFDMLLEWRRDGRVGDCRATSFEPLIDGIRPVDPGGTANPPPLRFEQAL